jgi:hypothetical protein
MKNTGKISVLLIWRVGPKNIFTYTALSCSFLNIFQFTCTLKVRVTEIWYKILLRVYNFNVYVYVFNVFDIDSVCFKHKQSNILIHIPCILLFFCSMTNKCTIISQIITLLHISTLPCHPQGTCNQYVAKLHKYFKGSCR